MSPIYGLSNPSYQIITDVSKVVSVDQMCEIEGFTPYIEFKKDALELEVGIVKTQEWAYYELGSISKWGELPENLISLELAPPQIFSGKNASEEPLTFHDISGYFNKDTGYFLSEYDYVLDTDYDVRNSSNGFDLGEADINYSGLSQTGQTDFSGEFPDSGTNGYWGFCYSIHKLDCQIYWHSVVDVNKLEVPIAKPSDSNPPIICNE